MSTSSHNRSPDLTLVAEPERPAARELDWSIYMARAQAGDRDAYRRLLEDVTPYLRSIAARHFQNSGDIEDTGQEALLTAVAALKVATHRALKSLRKVLGRQNRRT